MFSVELCLKFIYFLGKHQNSLQILPYHMYQCSRVNVESKSKVVNLSLISQTAPE
jgi:hypothetical protein